MPPGGGAYRTGDDRDRCRAPPRRRSDTGMVTSIGRIGRVDTVCIRTVAFASTRGSTVISVSTSSSSSLSLSSSIEYCGLGLRESYAADDPADDIDDGRLCV